MRILEWTLTIHNHYIILRRGHSISIIDFRCRDRKFYSIYVMEAVTKKHMSKFSRTQLKRKSLNYSDFQIKNNLKDLSRLQRSLNKRYDIFLSHNFLDAEIIFGLKEILEESGFSVFVDWIEAPELDRKNVTPVTAAYLRDAMRRSNSLLYAVSENSDGSKWMPWELGFSDGLHGHVAIVPISEYENTADSYQGKEYLGLYPYVTAESYQFGLPRILVRKSAGASPEDLKGWLGYKRAAY